jgi:hypothetical protein
MAPVRRAPPRTADVRVGVVDGGSRGGGVAAAATALGSDGGGVADDGKGV